MGSDPVVLWEGETSFGDRMRLCDEIAQEDNRLRDGSLGRSGMSPYDAAEWALTLVRRLIAPPAGEEG